MFFRDAEIAFVSTYADMMPDEKVEAALKVLRDDPGNRSADDIVNAYQ